MFDSLFRNQQVINQPIFYLFIAFTILISLGYSWGKRRNKRIFLSAFNDLVSLLKPKDQLFTNIGGLTGYHANFIPKKNDVFRRVDATITLLPRQSWLYMPFSIFIQKFDRLFLTFYLVPKKKAKWHLKEVHLIESAYSKFRAPKIKNENKLTREEFKWDNKNFLLFYNDKQVRNSIIELAKKMGKPGSVKHIAVVPKEERIFIFLVPKYKRVYKNLKPIINWITSKKFVVEQIEENRV